MPKMDPFLKAFLFPEQAGFIGYVQFVEMCPPARMTEGQAGFPTGPEIEKCTAEKLIFPSRIRGITYRTFQFT